MRWGCVIISQLNKFIYSRCSSIFSLCIYSLVINSLGDIIDTLIDKIILAEIILMAYQVETVTNS